MQGRGERDLDAELVRPMRLALADAFDFGRVQGIDFPAALVLALLAHALSQPKIGRENALQFGLAPDLACEVADDASEMGADGPERPIGALELLGVGVALMGDQGPLAHPFIGLAQAHAGLSRKPHQSFARPMHKLRVGRKGDRLRLHRGVDDHAREVRWSRRADARRRREALLDQRRELLLAHALSPARQRRAVEGRFVLKELLAAEQLKIRVLDPALAQSLVRQVMHRLEDRQARHEPGRQRRMTGLVRMDRPEPLLEKPSVDGAGELRQRVGHVDDLVEPRPEQVVLSALPPLLRPHRIILRPLSGARESRPKAPRNLQANPRPNRPSRQSSILPNRPKTPKNQRVSAIFTDD